MNARIGLVAAVTAIVFWAAGNIIVRSVNIGGAQLAFWRVLATAIVYWIVLLLIGRRLTWQHIKTTTPAAVAISIELVLFFVALKTTTVANSTVIGALLPIVILLFGIRHFGEKLSGRMVTISLVALGGVALVVFGSTTQPIWSPRGDVLAFVAMLFFAAYYMFAKAARNKVRAFEFQTALWIVGSVVLLPFAMWEAGGLVVPELEHWRGILLLMLIPASGHFLMNWAHPRVKLSITSVLTLGIPVLSTLGAAFLLDEPMVGWQILGMAIVISALALVIQREASLRADHPEEELRLEREPAFEDGH